MGILLGVLQCDWWIAVQKEENLKWMKRRERVEQYSSAPDRPYL
jgi:hypothetical protein